MKSINKLFTSALLSIMCLFATVASADSFVVSIPATGQQVLDCTSAFTGLGTNYRLEFNGVQIGSTSDIPALQLAVGGVAVTASNYRYAGQEYLPTSTTVTVTPFGAIGATYFQLTSTVVGSNKAIDGSVVVSNVNSVVGTVNKHIHSALVSGTGSTYSTIGGAFNNSNTAAVTGCKVFLTGGNSFAGGKLDIYSIDE